MGIMRKVSKEEAKRLAQQEIDRHKAIAEQKEDEGTKMETKAKTK